MFKESAQWNAFILFLPIVLGLLLGLLFVADPKFLVLPICSVGLSLFFIAKCSQFYKKKWVSLGTSGMPKIYQNLYWIGYLLMGLSVFISVGLIITQRL